MQMDVRLSGHMRDFRSRGEELDIGGVEGCGDYDIIVDFHFVVGECTNFPLFVSFLRYRGDLTGIQVRALVVDGPVDTYGGVEVLSRASPPDKLSEDLIITVLHARCTVRSQRASPFKCVYLVHILGKQ